MGANVSYYYVDFCKKLQQTVHTMPERGKQQTNQNCARNYLSLVCSHDVFVLRQTSGVGCCVWKTMSTARRESKQYAQAKRNGTRYLLEISRNRQGGPVRKTQTENNRRSYKVSQRQIQQQQPQVSRGGQGWPLGPTMGIPCRVHRPGATLYMVHR